MFIKGEHISLRAMEHADIELLYEWENNIELWHVSNTQTPFSRHVLKEFVDNSQYDIYTNKQLRLMVVENSTSETIGTIDFFEFDVQHARVGVGIYIHQNYTGKGYAYESLRLAINYCFNILHLKQVYSIVNAINAPSLKLFEKAGFEKTGVKKAWNKTALNHFEDALFLQLINDK
jgi:diamine N-acetyltransferase